MTKKSAKPFRMAPLQKLTVKPITDPAEQAALDERLKRGEEAASAARPPDWPPGKGATPLTLDLFGQLPAETQLLVATELAFCLSLDQRIELTERLTAEFPPEILRGLERRWRGQAGYVDDDGSGEVRGTGVESQ